MVCDHKRVGCFQFRSDGFNDFEMIVFENYKSITEFCLFFLILSTCYLYSLMRGHTPHAHYWRSEAHLNMF